MIVERCGTRKTVVEKMGSMRFLGISASRITAAKSVALTSDGAHAFIITYDLQISNN